MTNQWIGEPAGDDESRSAEDLLGGAQTARRRARLARRACWFPLLLFGLIVMVSTPLYITDPRTSGAIGYQARWFTYLPRPAGGPSLGLSLYWLIVPLAGYAAVAAFYIWLARHRGVRARVLPFSLVGTALVAVTVLTSPLGPLPAAAVPGDLWIRGLDPLIGISLGIGILAWLERSLGLATFSCVFFAVALVANLYDVSNQAHLIGWTPSLSWEVVPNLWLAGLLLLLGGAGFLLAERIRPGATPRVAAERQ